MCSHVGIEQLCSHVAIKRLCSHVAIEQLCSHVAIKQLCHIIAFKECVTARINFIIIVNPDGFYIENNYVVNLNMYMLPNERINELCKWQIPNKITLLASLD